MQLPTDFAEILKDNRFAIQVIHGRQGDMRKAVRRRLDDGQAWHWAIVRGEKSHPKGMMLIRVTTSHFEGLYLEHASCGTTKPSTRYTAAVLHLLGVGASEKEVFAELQKHNNFLVLNIHPSTELPVSLEPLA